jgi:hypothetical protein
MKHQENNKFAKFAAHLGQLHNQMLFYSIENKILQLNLPHKLYTFLFLSNDPQKALNIFFLGGGGDK